MTERRYAPSWRTAFLPMRSGHRVDARFHIGRPIRDCRVDCPGENECTGIRFVANYGILALRAGAQSSARMRASLAARQVETTHRFREATAYMANWLSRPEHIANYRAMASILRWDRRIKYNALIIGLEELRAFSDMDFTWENDQALDVIRRLSVDFELCLPNTSDYFDGLWRRSPKAMTFAMYVNYIAGVD